MPDLLVVNQTGGDVVSQDFTAISEEIAQSQEEILNKLRQAGVSAVRVKVSGSNDESHVDEIVASPNDIDLSTIVSSVEMIHGRATSHTLEDEVESLTFDVIEFMHPKFEEDNDGGEGLFEIHVPSGRMKLSMESFHETDVIGETLEGDVFETLNELFEMKIGVSGWPRSKDDAQKILDRLRESGATALTIEYAGYGDEGESMTITLNDDQNNMLDIDALSVEGLTWTEYRSPRQATEEASALWLKKGDGHTAIQKDGHLWLGRHSEIHDMESLLNDFANSIVCALHPGYENNKGGTGNLSINLQTMKLIHTPSNVGIGSDTQVNEFGPPHSSIIEAERPRSERIKG